MNVFLFILTSQFIHVWVQYIQFIQRDYSQHTENIFFWVEKLFLANFEPKLDSDWLILEPYIQTFQHGTILKFNL